jgi:hypothetical protein
MQIVPLEAAHLFDLNAVILGWLLAAVQPKKQHPRQTCISPVADFQNLAEGHTFTNLMVFIQSFLDGNKSPFGARRECIHAFLRAPLYHYSPVIFLLYVK